jgi:hypothetical protein
MVKNTNLDINLLIKLIYIIHIEFTSDSHMGNQTSSKDTDIDFKINFLNDILNLYYP